MRVALRNPLRGFRSAPARFLRLRLRNRAYTFLLRGKPPRPLQQVTDMPRPRRAEQKTAPMQVRLTPAERAELAAAAADAGLTVSDYIRRRALGRRITARVDLTVINELRRLGGLVKHLTLGSHIDAEAGREALAELREAVARIAP
jgi:hypothetical protein